MTAIETDVVVIGAGPAGLSAALELAQGGVAVAVIDAGTAPGGQYWMREILSSAEGVQSAEGAAKVAAVLDAGARICSGAEVWAVFPEPDGRWTIAAAQGEQPLEITTRSIIVAGGAHDWVMPFPGWTLPGVMTPGAGQRLVKLSGVAPGRRIALAGSGPFLLAVAATLEKAGHIPVAFIEARKPRVSFIAGLLGHPRRWPEVLRLNRSLRRIPTRCFGWVVTEALGTDRVEAVRIGPVRADGSIDSAHSVLLPDIDALLIGYGFRPSIEVSSLLRCRHRYAHAAGGWICEADATTARTSVPRVYAAGEASGIGGFRPARLAGSLAALSALEDLGKSPADLAKAIDAGPSA